MALPTITHMAPAAPEGELLNLDVLYCAAPALAVAGMAAHCDLKLVTSDYGMQICHLQVAPAAPEEEAPLELDALFRATAALPKLYWLPLTAEEAAARAAKLAKTLPPPPAIAKS